ncbi:MAG TPA: hypothetical protein EYP04_13270, partial [Anaerolineae bacterium]|nr:hypothetical protein [Anaerolineae bacterium]
SGCGHVLILDKVNEALVRIQPDPRKVVIVSDIGCVGLSDQYFVTNAFHGLHGRSVAYASGIKLANPDLTVIVMMGDGGTGIGGTHLVNAARRNIGVTVLVFNNFNFGMTGGEHSVTTPTGGRTATTRDGNLERPLDICATVAANGAGYVWRGTAFDKGLADRIAEAIRFEGFALLDIWELCTAYYVPNNDFSRKALFAMLERMGMPTGIVHQEARPEFARMLRSPGKEVPVQEIMPPRVLPTKYESPLTRKFHLVIAGSAGGRVRSTARAAGVAGVLSGLWVTQRDDYPTTVKSGHSVSELIFSPEEIRYTGITKPDALILLTADGYGKVHHLLPRMTPQDWLFVSPQFADVESPARKVVVDFKASGIRASSRNLAIMTTGVALRMLDLYPAAALEEAVRLTQRPVVAEENLRALTMAATFEICRV